MFLVEVGELAYGFVGKSHDWVVGGFNVQICHNDENLIREQEKERQKLKE